MKKIIILIFILVFPNLMDAQNNISVSDICKIFRQEFKTVNINSDYDNTIEIYGFNFNTMKPEKGNINQNLKYKLYYLKDILKRISVYDTSSLNRNWDFDIIYSSKEILISTVFIFDSTTHNRGDYFNGLLLNDRLNNKTLIFHLGYEADNSLYITSLIYDVDRLKKRNYEPKIIPDCENYIFSILEVDRNLFPLKRLNWDFQIFYSRSYFHYNTEKIIEELLIMNQLSRRPYSSKPYKKLLSKHTLEDLYHLLKIGYNNTFSIIFPILYSDEFPKNKPIWTNKKFYYYYIDRPEVNYIDLPDIDDK